MEIVGEARPARRAAEGAIKTPPGAGSLRRGSGFEGGVQSIEPLAPCGGANQEVRSQIYREKAAMTGVEAPVWRRRPDISKRPQLASPDGAGAVSFATAQGTIRMNEVAN